MYGGIVTIDGNLSFGSSANFIETWGNAGNDELVVTGTATLAGTISMVDDSAAANTWITALNAGTIVGNFGTHEFVGDSTPVNHDKETSGGTTSYLLLWVDDMGG